MRKSIFLYLLTISLLMVCIVGCKRSTKAHQDEKPSKPALTCYWEDRHLYISGDKLPGKVIEIHYLEGYCISGSTNRLWPESLIPFESRLISINEDSTEVIVEDNLSDSTIFRHKITCKEDEVVFEVEGSNPTSHYVDVQWAQPCIRVGRFTGFHESEDQYEYIKRCFIFMDGEITMMPTDNWATEAIYVPGQVWHPAAVPVEDINPRPISTDKTSNGLIGCFSEDNSMILATAWEPYQELFQGVLMCIHSDFRIGGLDPGQRKTIKGKIYLVENDISKLLERYREDFPEHFDPSL